MLASIARTHINQRLEEKLADEASLAYRIAALSESQEIYDPNRKGGHILDNYQTWIDRLESSREQITELRKTAALALRVLKEVKPQ
jgi:hypothetical protein